MFWKNDSFLKRKAEKLKYGNIENQICFWTEILFNNNIKEKF